MTTSLLRVQHSSLQFSDNPSQQRSDVEKIFKLGTRFPIKTVTEASDSTKLGDIVAEVAADYGHVAHFYRGNAVLVDRDIIKRGTVQKDGVLVVKNDHLVGKMHDRAFPTIKFDHINEGIGEINYGAFHFATKGAKPGDPNFWANEIYAKKIAQWMKDAGRGSALSMGAGDFNMNDRLLDLALGQNYTTSADELEDWQNTGHGPIDAFISYDRDGRVKAKAFNVLDDKEFPLHTDHYMLRGIWEIRNLK